MRAAVYNRYWSTGGGAEKYGGAIARFLTRGFDVDLLSHDAVDLDWLAERLQLDLSGVRVRELPDRSGAATAASADYDLFANVSFMSADRAASRRSLYVVHFPTPTVARLPPHTRFLVDHLGGIRSSMMAHMEWGTGFYHRELGRRAPIWTNGEGHLRFTTPPGQDLALEIIFGYHRPPSLPPAEVTIEVAGRTAATFRLGARRSRLHGLRGRPVRVPVCSQREREPVDVRILSDTFVPAEVDGSADRRTLGVPLLGMHIGLGSAARLARLFPVLLTPPVRSDWHTSYGALVANSRFTQDWIERWWDAESEVLHPPVTMQTPGEKRPTILNVGRFFPGDHGHSKKQLEMVRAFRTLCDRGVEGWTLHLAGGCSAEGESYVRRVRDAARGYPVEVHVNVPGAELRRLYASASIYWHASGLGESVTRHPDRFEHFGITTAEAMSAGAVPVVIGMAGQRETVRHGVDGFHFRSLGGLTGLTQMLIDDESLRAQCSRSASARAREFAIDAFEERLGDLVERIMMLPDRTAEEGGARLDGDGSTSAPRIPAAGTPGVLQDT